MLIWRYACISFLFLKLHWLINNSLVEKKSSSPLRIKGKKKNNAIQNSIVSSYFFFGRKGNEFGDNLKIDYDNCSLFTILTE